MRGFFVILSGAAVILAAMLAGGCVTPVEGAGDPGPGQSGDPIGEQPGDSDLKTILFVLGPNTGFVGFDNAQSLSGANLPASTELMSSNNTVIQPRDAALDSRGALYLISGAKGGSIAIYDNPLTATGNRAPDRVVSGDATLIANNPSGIAIDRDNELLYLSNPVGDLLVFNIATPQLFNGDIAPVRTFRVNQPLFNAEQIRFANGSLYVVDARGGTSDILAFDNPSALQGDVTPDRVISNAGFDNTIGIDIDAQDRLWVGVRDLGQVLLFNAAKSLDGAATPDVALSISDVDVAPKPSFATTDSEDRLYIADSNGNVVFVFDLASQLVSGAHAASRTIDSMELIAPNRLLVVER
ncbi:MAG: hypothetical protein SF069_02875 [Phycisphaerae bacterium]|nr:hypothetical protein [Phycisphaerae bacterium]